MRPESRAGQWHSSGSCQFGPCHCSAAAHGSRESPLPPAKEECSRAPVPSYSRRQLSRAGTVLELLPKPPSPCLGPPGTQKVFSCVNASARSPIATQEPAKKFQDKVSGEEHKEGVSEHLKEDAGANASGASRAAA